MIGLNIAHLDSFGGKRGKAMDVSTASLMVEKSSGTRWTSSVA